MSAHINQKNFAICSIPISLLLLHTLVDCRVVNVRTVGQAIACVLAAARRHTERMTVLDEQRIGATLLVVGELALLLAQNTIQEYVQGVLLCVRLLLICVVS